MEISIINLKDYPISNVVNKDFIATDIPDPYLVALKIIQIDQEAELARAQIKRSFRIKASCRDLTTTHATLLKYIKQENWVRENFSQIPTSEISGSLHYGMSLKQMQEKITHLIRDLAENGQLIREESLEKDYDRSSFYPNGTTIINITRIWGSIYLQKNLPSEGRLKAAKHFLIVNKKCKSISIKIGIGDETPVVAEVKNGYVLAEKIIGSSCGETYEHTSLLKNLNYYDLTGPRGNDNILSTASGDYIVDTEKKSFAESIKFEHSLFLRKRFIALNKTYIHTFNISLKNILAE